MYLACKSALLLAKWNIYLLFLFQISHTWAVFIPRRLREFVKKNVGIRPIMA